MDERCIIRRHPTDREIFLIAPVTAVALVLPDRLIREQQRYLLGKSF